MKIQFNINNNNIHSNNTRKNIKKLELDIQSFNCKGKLLK